MPLQGDASTRAYERLRASRPASAILMISPRARRRAAGAPASPTARSPSSPRACMPSSPWRRACARLGSRAPRDLRRGSRGRAPPHRGSRRRAGASTPTGPIPERYAEARGLLAEAASAATCPTVPVADGARPRDTALRSRGPADRGGAAARLVRAAHPRRYRVRLGPRASSSISGREALEAIARRARDLDPARLPFAEPDLAAASARGCSGSGCIDFQDAVLGHPAYDVASLLQDARVDRAGGARAEARRPLRPRARKAADAGIRHRRASRAPTRSWARSAATKMLGIFARLDKRDGKPQYLQHLPRLETYLAPQSRASRPGGAEGLV